MSPTSATPSTPTRSWGGALAIGAAVLLIGLLAYTLVSGPGAGDAGTPVTETTAASDAAWRLWFNPDRIGFAPLTVPNEEIATARASVPAEGSAPKQELLDDALDAFQTLNRLEAKGTADSTELNIVTRRFNTAVRELYAPHSRLGLQTLYDTIWPNFTKALNTFAAADAPPILDRVASPPDDATREAVAWAGGFVRLAVPTGLMSDTGDLTPNAIDLLPILLRYRLAQGLQGSIDPRELMTPPELRTLALWRLQTSSKLPPANRQRALMQVIQHIPTYPAAIATGVLYYQGGQIKEAVGTFQAARLDDPSLAPLLDVYIAQIEAEQSKSP